MDLHQQFIDIVLQQEKADEHLSLSREEILPYLQDMLPIELFLKEIYRNSRNNLLWEYPMLVQEAYRFRGLPPTLNIKFSRHYRYDCCCMHQHNYFQLNYVREGTPVIRCGDEQYTTQPGDFFLLAPGVMHCIESADDHDIILKIYIKYSTFENTFFRLLGEKNVLTSFFRKVLYQTDSSSKYICFHTGNDLWLQEHILESYRMFCNRMDYLDIIMECRITELFCVLVSSYMEATHSSMHAEVSANIGKIVSYIHRKYATVTLEETAAWIGYTKHYLCHLLKSSTGKTFTDIVNTIRSEKACQFLTTTDLSINEIASRTGFGTIKHFYRVFREHTGTTPLQYRQGHMQDN